MSKKVACFRWVPVKSHSKTEVCYGACEVSLDEDISWLDVPVSDGGLGTGARDLCVEVRNAGRSRMGQSDLHKKHI